MFIDREDAARQLAAKLRGRDLTDPVVLGIPRGGVVTAAVIAQELGADLDVVLARKLRAPGNPELAIGAVAEDGQIHLNDNARQVPGLTANYLEAERRRQLAEIARRKKLFREVRAPAPVAGRTVIVADDGIATGATMLAALQVIAAQSPKEVIVAAPVASPDRVTEIRRSCDDVVCLLTPDDFWAVGQFYEDFRQVEDDEVLQLLRTAAGPQSTARPSKRSAARS